MDYKEKYEAALERARMILCNIPEGESCKDIETIFPELAESEDERVRKWLYDYFSNIGEKNWIHREVTCEQVLTWLEKQKEPNSPDSTGLYYYDGKKFTCCGFPYNFTMNQQEEQKTVAISENNNSDANGHLTGKILVEYGAHAKVRDGKRHCEMDWKEFQRLAHYFYELGKTEQKPVECLKAERDGWYICIKDFYAGGKKQCSVGDLVQAKGGMYMMGEEDISEWFRKAYYEEVRDAFGPNTDTNIPEQKSAEWSEEDEKMLDSIIYN